MDNKTRYDLMVKLSDFYVKNVQKNLDEFNKIRVIAGNFTHVLSFIFIVATLTCFSLAFLFFTFILIFFLPNSYIIPSFNIIIVFFFIFFLLITILCTAIIRITYINESYKKHMKHILKNDDVKNKLPSSADSEIKKHLMVKFLQIFGNLNWCYGSEFGRWKNIEFIKSWKILNNPISAIDDYITGEYKGINLKICDINTSLFRIEFLAGEVFFTGLFMCFYFIWLPVVLLSSAVFFIKHLTSKSFNGVFIELDMNKKFEGQTFILEKDNIKDNLTLSKTYEKVNLEDSEFAQEFCVYSQNQIEARYILTTSMIDRLKKLKEIYKAEYIRAAFKDEKIIIMIQTGRDMFQMAGKSQITKETFIQLFDEITSVLDIIDILKLNEKLGL